MYIYDLCYVLCEAGGRESVLIVFAAPTPLCFSFPLSLTSIRTWSIVWWLESNDVEE